MHRSRILVLPFLFVLAACGGSAVTLGDDVPSPSPGTDGGPAAPAPGPGWTAALWREAEETTLVVVDPTGAEVREVARWPLAAAPYAIVDLAPGSGDVLALGGDPATHARTVVRVALSDGTETRVAEVPELSQIDARFAGPDGDVVIVARRDESTETIDRVDRGGAVTPVASGPAPGADRWWLEPILAPSPAGDRVAVAAASGIRLIDVSDGSEASLPVAGRGCTPARWWDEATVLASCVERTRDEYAIYGRLWLVPVDGDTPEALTPAAPPDVPVVDFGYHDAWATSAGLVVQWLGDCGAASAVRLDPDEARVDLLPDGAAHVAGIVGDRIVAVLSDGCDTPGSLVAVDPATGAVEVLMDRGTDDAGLRSARVWPAE